MSAFIPGTTYVLAVTGSTQNKLLWAAVTGAIANPQIAIYNSGAAAMWFTAGGSTITSVIPVTSGPAFVVLAGTLAYFSINAANNYLAYISAGASGTAYVTVGSGI